MNSEEARAKLQGPRVIVRNEGLKKEDKDMRRSRLCTAACWLAAVIFLVWASLDLFGPAGAKIVIALLLFSCGGWIPLSRVVLHGLVLAPFKHWFTGKD